MPPLYGDDCYTTVLQNTTHDGPALRGFSSDVGFSEAGHRCVMDPQCAAVVQSEFGRHTHVLRSRRRLVPELWQTG